MKRLLNRQWIWPWLGVLLWVGNVRGANAAATPDPLGNPLVPMWRDAEWVRRFLNYDGTAEPRLTAEEQALYRSLEDKKLLSEKPLQAAQELESRITPASSPMLSYTVGTLYFREGDNTNAIRHYRVAVDKNDRFLRAQKNLGLACVREGQYDAAILPLTRTAALGGGDGLTYGLLGFCALNLERYLTAETAYRQAVLFDPENADWRLGLVKCYVAMAEYGAAVRLLDELLQRFPERESLWVLQANVFVQMEQPRRAIVNLDAVRRLGKATAANLNLLGDLYLAQESRELALEAYLAAVEKDAGQNPRRAIRAAEILAGRGAWTEADRLIRTARERFADALADEEGLALLRVEARVAMGSGSGEKAIDTLEQILRRSPLDGEALLLAGDYYARNDQREKAEMRYQAAAELDAFRADAWVKQAQLLISSKKYPEAIELLRRAQKLKPRDNVARYLEKVELAASRSARS